MKTFYQSKADTYKAAEKHLKQKSNRYLIGKLTSFTIAAIFTYLSFTEFSYFHVASAALLFIFYLYLCVKDSKCRTHIDRLIRMQQVCSQEIAYLNGHFSSLDAGTSYINPQHEFSFDLDVFGEKSLFQRINRTITQKGSDRLAQRLTCLPTCKEEITAHQEAVKELAGLGDWRIRFMSHPHINNHLDMLIQFVQHNQSSHRFIRSFGPYVCVGATLCCFLAAAAGLCSWYYFEALFLLNLAISLLFRKTLAKINLQAEQLHKDFKSYQDILTHIQHTEFQSDRLKKIKSELFDGETNSIQSFHELAKILNLFNLRASDLLYLLLNGTLLFDVILIKRFMPWCQQSLPHIEQWLDSIAEIDAYVSMGNYAGNHPKDTYAEILPPEALHVIQAEDVFHPFLNREKAVANSFTLDKQNIAIITGANMAGKSTFLRTIGISYILASNGMPVCARSFRFSIIGLFSSMRTTDDLSNDISYFHAELLRLKQLLEYVQSHPFSLIILDEILKGTNSKDKLEGSVLFLQEISQYPLSAIIATHDLELARLEKENEQLYSNYRFEIELSEDIHYTYKIEPGVAQNLNASYLLAGMLKANRQPQPTALSRSSQCDNR